MYSARGNKVKCMWYNEDGWPRINPKLQKRLVDPPVGCDIGDTCKFVHPSDADWAMAQGFRAPPPHYYWPGTRPPTPDPHLARRSSPVRKSKVKQEVQSSVLLSPGELRESAIKPALRRSRSRSRDRALTTRVGPNKGRSPPPLRPYYGHPRERRPSTDLRSPIFERGRSPRDDHRRSHSRDKNDRERGEKPDLLDRISMDVDEKRVKTHKGEIRKPEADISPIATNSRPPPLAAADVPPVSANSQVSFSSTTMPPPAPSTPTMRQTPTTPRAPSFAPSTSQVETKKEELTPEAKYKRWSERISLLAEAIRARTKYDKLVADRQSLEALSCAPRMAELNGDVRERMEKAVGELNEKCEEAKGEVDARVERVWKSEYWPVMMERQSAAELEMEKRETAVQESQDRLQAQVLRVSGEVQKLERGLKEVATWVGSRSRTGAAGVSLVGPGTGARVRRAEEDWEESVGKKRRVEEPPAYESQAEEELLHKIQKSIRNLDTRMHELEEEGIQALDDIERAVQEQVENEVEKLEGELGREKERRKEMERRQETIERKIVKFDADINDLVRDVASLVETTPEVEAARAGLEERYQELHELVHTMQAAIAQQQADNGAIRTQVQIAADNNAAVRSALAARPQITLDSITDSLLPRILDAVRGELRPVLSGHRRQIEETLREHAHVVSLLREKLDRIALVPEAVQRIS